LRWVDHHVTAATVWVDGPLVHGSLARRTAARHPTGERLASRTAAATLQPVGVAGHRAGVGQEGPPPVSPRADNREPRDRKVNRSVGSHSREPSSRSSSTRTRAKNQPRARRGRSPRRVAAKPASREFPPPPPAPTSNGSHRGVPRRPARTVQ
jgi:hypothetical protein